MKNEYDYISDNEVVIYVKGYDRIFECIIDSSDLEEVMSIPNRWYVSERRGMYYVYYQPYIDGKRRTVQLHQFLMGTWGKGRKGDIVVDHIDGDTMNNRRSNLQITTQSVNTRKSKLHKTNTSGHRNIVWRETKRKYQVEFWRNGKTNHLGYYETIEEAVAVRDEYLKNEHIPRPNKEEVK